MGSGRAAASGVVLAWNPSHQDDTGSDWHEYEVCGDIVKRTEGLLPGFTHVLCWETGMGLTSSNVAALQSECDQAAAAHAQVFISVHVNSAASSGFTGRYYPGDSASARYAEALLRSMAEDMGLEYHNVYAASLHVLDPKNNPTPIRVLFECGGNRVDRPWLSTEKGRQKLAAALAKAIVENTPPATRYEEDDERLAYAGVWTSSRTMSASERTFRYADTAGASVTVKFSGTRIDWIAKKSPVYGRASVTVDGGKPQSVDLFDSSALFQRRVWSSGPLSAGEHTVRISVTGKKRADAEGVSIGVDAFDVKGTLLRP